MIHEEDQDYDQEDLDGNEEADRIDAGYEVQVEQEEEPDSNR